MWSTVGLAGTAACTVHAWSDVQEDLAVELIDTSCSFEVGNNARELTISGESFGSNLGSGWD